MPVIKDKPPGPPLGELKAAPAVKTVKQELLETPFITRLVAKAETNITPFVDNLAGVLGDEGIRSRWDDALVRSMPKLNTGAAVHEMEYLQTKGGDQLVAAMAGAAQSLNQLSPSQTLKFFEAVKANPMGVNVTKLVANLKAKQDEGQ